MDEIIKAMTGGIVFKPAPSPKNGAAAGKVKTKAKKKAYKVGAHGSGAAKMKAEYRRKRAARHKA